MFFRNSKYYLKGEPSPVSKFLPFYYHCNDFYFRLLSPFCKSRKLFLARTFFFHHTITTQKISKQIKIYHCQQIGVIKIYLILHYEVFTKLYAHHMK